MEFKKVFETRPRLQRPDPPVPDPHTLEDFSLLDFREIAEPFKTFHLIIRKKSLRRTVKDLDPPEDPSDLKFRVDEDVADQYEFYHKNYASLVKVHRDVDTVLLPELIATMRESYLRRAEKRHSEQPGFGLELELIVEEFKLLIEELSDFYQTVQLYKLANFESLRTFKKVDIDHRMRNFLIPFLTQKLFGRFNSVSSTLIQKALGLLLQRVLKYNAGYLQMVMPEVELVSEKTRVGKMVENFISSRVFEKEQSQMKFLLTFLNSKITDHIADLRATLDTLFRAEQPLDFRQFEVHHEVLNYKMEEINSMHLDDQKNSLDYETLCRLTKVKPKEEAELLAQAQKRQGGSPSKPLELSSSRKNSADDEEFQKKEISMVEQAPKEGDKEMGDDLTLESLLQ